MGHLSFNRTNTSSRRRAAQTIEDVLRAGDSVFVFPEGTFVPETGVRPFQLGAFKAAVDTGAPLVPVSLAGTRNILRDRTFLPRPGNVTITILSSNLSSQRRQFANRKLAGTRALARCQSRSNRAIFRRTGAVTLPEQMSFCCNLPEINRTLNRTKRESLRGKLLPLPGTVRVRKVAPLARVPLQKKQLMEAV